ncbi:MAG: hypothetical protein FJY54_15900 [Betaproteobacteria bacterium]|jgi:hypothetical protein|nr:hypothetical protein [Betaproteobacteria bacterium]
MGKHDVNHQHLIALFVLGLVLFNYPLLSLFNVPGTVLGIPVLYLYVFAAWGAVIGLLAWIIE